MGNAAAELSQAKVAGGDELFKASTKRFERRQKVLQFIWKWNAPFSVFLLVVGLVWVLLFPAVTVTTGELKCRGTYISENALLTDMLRSSLGKPAMSEVQRIQAEYSSLPHLSVNGCQDRCASSAQWLQQKLQSMGLEAYRQNFTDADGVKRENVYALLRAHPAADGKESIALVAHYRNLPAGGPSKETSGMAILMFLMKHLQTVTWLSKDVILLLADDGDKDGRDGHAPGTQLWLRQYHADPITEGGDIIFAHAGVIRAAVVVDVSGKKFDSLALLGAGLNGQLPNLDLLNTFHTAIQYNEGAGVPVVVDRCPVGRGLCQDFLQSMESFAFKSILPIVPSSMQRAIDNYLQHLFQLFRFMKTLASGPSGSHAHFISYNIDALSLTALDTNQPKKPRKSILRTLEMAVRAISNTEEKLHQSFWFYLLPSARTFVSIGEYYYSLALILSPSFFSLLRVSVSTCGFRTAFGMLAFMAFTVTGFLCYQLASSLHHYRTELELLIGLERSAGSTPFIWLGGSCVLSLFCLQVLSLLQRLPGLRGAETEAAFISTSALEKEQKEIEKAKKLGIELKPLFSTAPTYETDPGWRAVKVGQLLLISYAHAILGVLNFPLALWSAILCIPVSLLVPVSCPSFYWGRRALSALYVISMSPPLLLLALSGGQMAAFISELTRSHFLLGSVLFPLVCAVYLPAYLAALYILLFREEKRDKQKAE